MNFFGLIAMTVIDATEWCRGTDRLSRKSVFSKNHQKSQRGFRENRSVPGVAHLIGCHQLHYEKWAKNGSPVSQSS